MSAKAGLGEMYPGQDRVNSPASPAQDVTGLAGDANLDFTKLEDALLSWLFIFESFLVRGNSAMEFPPNGPNKHTPTRFDANAAIAGAAASWQQLNEADIRWWKLIRFLRNFLSHFRDDQLNAADKRKLFEEIIFLMSYSYAYAGNENDSSARVKTFMTKRTYDRLAGSLSSSRMLYPKAFLPANGTVPYAQVDWFSGAAQTDKDEFDFDETSAAFRDHIGSILMIYYNNRLKSRRRTAPTNEAHTAEDDTPPDTP